MNRRHFLTGITVGSSCLAIEPEGRAMDDNFASFQEKRRKELWNLLGDLPWQHQTKPVRSLKVEDFPAFQLEHLELDLNGQEPVPAYLLLPRNRTAKAPGMLYLHYHGGKYPLGKDELLRGSKELPAYAEALAEIGIVTLCIDAWCFGKRASQNGSQGEMDTFKRMLWHGQVLWGMMVYDDLRSLDYLSKRPEVDPERIGCIGMSMGSTRGWWLAALDPRIKLCIDICCLTDYQELLRQNHLKGHGIYYYVPRLLKHFQTAQITELIVPRRWLSVSGSRDLLTPPSGVEKIRDHMMPLFQKHGKQADCRIELFDCGHEETPAMRKLIMEWLKSL
jgi:cephalosporin-C deacetylase-like acetyl esterase